MSDHLRRTIALTINSYTCGVLVVRSVHTGTYAVDALSLTLREAIDAADTTL